MSIDELNRLELLMLYLKLALAKQDMMQASAIADEALQAARPKGVKI